MDTILFDNPDRKPLGRSPNFVNQIFKFFMLRAMRNLPMKTVPSLQSTKAQPAKGRPVRFLVKPVSLLIAVMIVVVVKIVKLYDIAML